MTILDDDAWIDSPRKADRPTEESGQGKQRCVDCKENFTMVLRKHHCKQCGDVFCGKCSSNYGSANVSKERNCIKCASKGMLLRRKAKPAKSLLKSVVVKSMKVDKFDNWVGENWSPNRPSKKAISAVDVPTVDTAKPLTPVPKQHIASSVVDAVAPLEEEQAEETEVLLAKPNDAILGDFQDEEDDVMMRSQGVLCILPPSVYSFIFGE